jgi:nicotinamide mononucleotide transporter
MQPILDLLYQSVFAIGGTPVTIVELLGFVLGIATVYLVAKANIWTFPIGIVQAGMFFILFLEAKLYADMWLQVFFIVVQFVGWWAWLKAGPNRSKLHVNNASKAVLGLTSVGIIAFAYIMVPVLREAHGAYPVADSTTTGLSVAAQILLTFKLIENWYLWILADIIYIPLYFVKDLYFTSILYAIFLGICIRGLIHWRNVQKGQGDGSPPNSSVALDAMRERLTARHKAEKPLYDRLAQ